MPSPSHGLFAALASVMILAGAAQAGAADAMKDRTEKLTLKGRKGPKLTRPGFEVGDYTGSAAARAFNRKGFGSLDKAKLDFDVSSPDWSQPVTGECAGGQSRFTLVLTWKREDLSYNCDFGGAAPAGARLELAVSKGGSLLARLQQPQRAGEIHWKDQVIQFETRQVGGMPISGGKPLGYVFSKDGVEIGGLDMAGGFKGPSFYLPPKRAPERDAVMVAALSLYFFPDPGNGG